MARLAAWLKIAHLAVGAFLVCYLVMVAVNSFGFGYNFWTEPPPTDAADTFAVVSLWVFWLLGAFIGAVAYGWMCELASEGIGDLVAQLRRAAGTTVRKCWIAVPAFALTVCACVVFAPGIVAVALFGPMPLRHLHAQGDGRPPPPKVPFGHAAMVGAAVAFAVAFLFVGSSVVGVTVVDGFDGAVEAVAALVAYLAYLGSALVAGWAAWEFGHPPPATGGGR